MNIIDGLKTIIQQNNSIINTTKDINNTSTKDDNRRSN